MWTVVGELLADWEGDDPTGVLIQIVDALDAMAAPPSAQRVVTSSRLLLALARWRAEPRP